MGTVFSGVLGPLIFLGALGIGVGGMVEENVGTVAGLDYLAFVAPGLLVAAAVQNMAGAALWEVMAGRKWIGKYHAAAATPLRPSDVYAGFLVWKGALTAMNAASFLVVAALLGGVPSWWGVLAVPATVLCALAFGAPLAAFSCGQDNDMAFAAIIRLFVLPLFLFSGTFFPLEDLPAAVRPVAWFTPLWHGVELSRGATTGSLGLGPALLHVGFLAGWVAVGGAWGVRVFTRRLAE